MNDSLHGMIRAHDLGDAMDKLVEMSLRQHWAIPAGRAGGPADPSPPVSAKGAHRYRKGKGEER